MNPHVALKLAEQHQLHLQGVVASPAPAPWSVRDLTRLASDSGQRARRAAGWLLVEVGLRLAVAAEPTSTVAGR